MPHLSEDPSGGQYKYPRGEKPIAASGKSIGYAVSQVGPTEHWRAAGYDARAIAVTQGLLSASGGPEVAANADQGVRVADQFKRPLV